MQLTWWRVLMGSLILCTAGCQTNHYNAHSNPFASPYGNQPNQQQMALPLNQAVQEALLRHDDLAVAPIHVEAEGNKIVLTGYVKKIKQSDTAELIARQVPGVGSVENHIIVRP